MSRYDLVQTDGLIAPAADSGGGASGDLALSTGGLAARSDLNAQSLTATGTGGTTPLTYSWSATRPDGTASTSEFTPNATTQNPTFNPARVGLYSVTCTVTDSAGTPLTASSTQAKTVGTALSAAISGFSNATDLAQQTVTATPSGGVSPYSYAWTCTRPDGTSSTSEFSSTSASNPNFTPASAGLHVVRCTVTDSASTSAIATGSANVGTGSPTVGSRVQLTSLSGWTAVEGPNTQSAWVSGAAITESSGVFTFADAERAVGTALNQPQEMKVYYSPASELAAVDFTGTPGVLQLRMEAQGSNALAGAKQYILFGIIDSAYSGSSTTDWVYGFITNEDSSGKSRGGVCMGNDAASVSQTSSANNNGQEILDCMIYINVDGDPDENVGNFFQGTTLQTRVLQSNVQVQFSANNDARLVLGIGRAHNGSVGGCSSTWKFYWSYSKIGA